MMSQGGFLYGSSAADVEAAKRAELAEKKRRRQERNKVSAKLCRERKRAQKMALRQELAHLEADNLQLRLKLQADDESNHLEQSAFVTAKLNEMIQEGATEAEIQRTIQELKERFSDYGRDRRSSVDFHISQLRRCLQPTQTTRAILWLMTLAPRFQNAQGEVLIPSSSSGGAEDELWGMWRSLLAACSPDLPQRRLMVSYTTTSSAEADPFQAIAQASAACEAMLDRIEAIVCSKNDSLDTEMANIQALLSARQIAKFILWIDQNPVCMQMLEALWPHITFGGNRSDSEDPVLGDGDADQDGDGDGDGDCSSGSES